MKIRYKPIRVEGAGKTQEDKNRAQCLAQKKLRKKERKRREANARVIDLVLTKLTNAREGRLPPIQQSYFQRRSLVEGYRQMVRDMGPIMFVTFMPGYIVQPGSLMQKMTIFWNMLQREATNKHWAKYTRDRVTALAFFEKPDITPHYHALAEMPYEMAEVLEREGARIWKKLMPRGKIDIQFIYDRPPLVRYVTKDLHHYWAPDNVYIYAPKTAK